jgi:hypothetical protein
MMFAAAAHRSLRLLRAGPGGQPARVGMAIILNMKDFLLAQEI